MIGSSENRVSYNGNGLTTEFPYAFKVLEKTDLKLLLVSKDGTETVLTSDYYVDIEKKSVFYPGYSPGAEPPTSDRPPVLQDGERLVIYRDVLITQETALDEHWPYNEIEGSLDKLTIIAQQLKDDVDRSLKVSIASPNNIDASIPLKAGKSFRWSDDGLNLELTEDPAQVLPMAQAAAELALENAQKSEEAYNGISKSIENQRPLKTYTTFEQLGLTSSCTLTQLLQAIPANSQFVRYIGTNQYKPLGLPDEGILEITKGQYLDYASLKLQRYGGDSIIKRAYFENWAKGQTVLMWQEVSKTYTAYEQLGFTSTPTLVELLEALPSDCKFVRYANITNAGILGLPNGCTFEITKGTLSDYANIVCMRSYGSEHKMWFDSWTKGQTAFNWKEVASKTPTLTAEQKAQIKQLAKDYYSDASNTFYYFGDLARNDYATANSWITSQSRWGINCETFVQMVWMGRSVDDFKGKTASTYSPNITKAFDWGYYWNFEQRTLLAGLAKRDENGEITGYYGFHQPNKDDAENPNKGSYSINTTYNRNSQNLYNQSFKSFMVAGDMAYELWKMGCEIPISELDVGDIIFNASDELYGEREDYTKGCWKRISHVSMVYDKAEDGTLTIVESSDVYGADTYPIFTVSEKSTIDNDKLRAYNIQRNCVKAFRHPAAFGLGGNVPNAITVLPKAYES